jgi:hypothetical protein
MARKGPETAGGALLASKIADFIKANTQAMKDGGSKDAAKNETAGINDTAAAIAYGIEQFMKQQFIVPNPASGMTLAAAPPAVTGTISLTGGIQFPLLIPNVRPPV